MLIIGCDYHPSMQQIHLPRYGDRRKWRATTDAAER